MAEWPNAHACPTRFRVEVSLAEKASGESEFSICGKCIFYLVSLTRGRMLVVLLSLKSV